LFSSCRNPFIRPLRSFMIFRSFAVRTFGFLGLGTSLALVGCGAGQLGTSGPLTGDSLTGSIHGGLQPISGARVYLYAAGTTGYGTGATSLLTGGYTTSGTGGGFTITNNYTCPSSSTQVYMVAVGGNTGSGVNNSSVLMSALGDCGALSSATFINISEVTSVAAAYALSQFMTPGTLTVGTSSTNVTGLRNAFATALNLVDPASGTARATTPAGNGIVPASTINTLANIMAACVNTTGGAGPCATLFTAATPAGGSAPTDTMSAMLNVAQNPGRNTASLYSLQPGAAVFQPSLSTVPNDFTLSVQYSGGGLHAGQLPAVDAAGNVWVPNAVDPGTLSEFSPTGAALTPSTGFTGGGLSVPEAVAIDLNGNVWAANYGNANVSEHTSGGTPLSGSGFTATGMYKPNSIAIDGSGNVFTSNGSSVNSTVTKFNSAGVAQPLFTGGGLDIPYFVAIDGSGNVWVANNDQTSNANSISKFSNSGTAASLTGYVGGGLTWPVAVAIDATGNVWAANYGAASVSKLSSTGVALSGAGYATPDFTNSIAIDGSNTVWTGNIDGSVSRLTNAGTAISPSTGYIANGALATMGIAIDASGNVWATDYNVNSLFEFVGAAGPAVVPQALAVKNGSFGVRP
jgi:hypothetical protein